MATLILALDGPLQAWGASGRFAYRTTEQAPTKSGVVGLLAAAQGRSRTDSFDDLLTLSFGVRTDQQGRVGRDFQTETDWRTGKSHPLSYRDYLQDYKFTAVVEGERDVLEELQAALRAPRFPLFLGRRACPPAAPVPREIRGSGLVEALREAPWLAAEWYRRRQPTHVQLPVVRDGVAGEEPDTMVRDVPVSFDPRNRRYALRGVVHDWVAVENPSGRSPDHHDPFAVLGGL
ncbi:type I-E CRISPR-associated protein Cas5/CasD [Corynebacterium bovis]|uniref:type I-E CRISPR-associated protein Cas5/CasD n=1 Tax=Corynebacterium bovis TaxID=36808 RepID=UPI0031387BBC